MVFFTRKCVLLNLEVMLKNDKNKSSKFFYCLEFLYLPFFDRMNINAVDYKKPFIIPLKPHPFHRQTFTFWIFYQTFVIPFSTVSR